MSDGSGVTLNHLTYNTYAPTDHTVGLTGDNVMPMTRSNAPYTNKFPNLYQSDYCSDADMIISADLNTESIA